jgi:hypothetical protein
MEWDGLAAGVGPVCHHRSRVIRARDRPCCRRLSPRLPRYNFNPATIFLGDSGSLFVGFLLGRFGVFLRELAGSPEGRIKACSIDLAGYVNGRWGPFMVTRAAERAGRRG